MKNKNLLIALGVGVVVYYFYNKKQKEKLQSTPYTDAELTKVVTDLVNRLYDFAKGKEMPYITSPSILIDSLKSMIRNASLDGANVGRANIDKLLALLEIQTRNELGDNSKGVITAEQRNFMMKYDKSGNFVKSDKQTIKTVNVAQNSQGFFPQTPVGQSQIAPINVGSEERNMGGGLYIKYGKCDSVTYKCQIVSVRQLAQGEGGGYVRTFTEKGMYFKEKGNVNVAPIVTQITEKEWSDLMEYVLKRTGF